MVLFRPSSDASSFGGRGGLGMCGVWHQPPDRLQLLGVRYIPFPNNPTTGVSDETATRGERSHQPARRFGAIRETMLDVWNRSFMVQNTFKSRTYFGPSRMCFIWVGDGVAGRQTVAVLSGFPSSHLCCYWKARKRVLESIEAICGRAGVVIWNRVETQIGKMHTHERIHRYTGKCQLRPACQQLGEEKWTCKAVKNIWTTLGWFFWVLDSIRSKPITYPLVNVFERLWQWQLPTLDKVRSRKGNHISKF